VGEQRLPAQLHKQQRETLDFTTSQEEGTVFRFTVPAAAAH
jgi:hypothetical protein